MPWTRAVIAASAIILASFAGCGNQCFIASAGEPRAEVGTANIDQMCRALLVLIRSAETDKAAIEKSLGANPSPDRLELVRSFDRQIVTMRGQVSELRQIVERAAPGTEHGCK